MLIRLLHKLVSKGQTLPRGLLVTGVQRIGAHPVAGGGFADVWQGVLRGAPVALKVLRVFGDPKERTATYQVCQSRFVLCQRLVADIFVGFLQRSHDMEAV